MGGVSCWKHIIDGYNALNRQLGCMAETIRIAGATDPSKLPTYDDEKEFMDAAETLGKIAAGIQAKCETASLKAKSDPG